MITMDFTKNGRSYRVGLDNTSSPGLFGLNWVQVHVEGKLVHESWFTGLLHETPGSAMFVGVEVADEAIGLAEGNPRSVPPVGGVADPSLDLGSCVAGLVPQPQSR